jgi:hypothetical protein
LEKSSGWGDTKSGDCRDDGAPEEGELAMLLGWAYLIAGLMTMDALLLALWLMNKDWPKRWKK